jgi:succinyl-CoA synthetase alpha subunit
MTVFLSYALEDKPRIQQVIDLLKARGMLLPHEEVVDTSEIVVPGITWRGQIRDAIANASKFVVIWSDAANMSDWVNYETGMAEALGKSILIVVPKGEASRIPDNLTKTQVIEMEEVA